MKDSGECKTRTVADGSQQRGSINDEDKASPTVSLAAILLTALIEAVEEREVATLDIPNAFLHSDLPEDEQVIMKLTSKLAEIMETIVPEIYHSFIRVEQGKKVLYVKLQKALYGLLKAALLFYEKLSSDLVEEGFTIHPYDPCVANKMIDGEQMTVVWHVDDLKVSHKSKQEVDSFIKRIRNRYEDDAGKVKITRGKIHKYLGMTLDYSIPFNIRIGMLDYVEKIIDDFPEVISSPAKTPASEHLFKVDEDTPKIDADRAEIFHTTIAKCLFLCKRARPDIQVAVAFLTTRVTEPDEDDWKKLVRLIKYLYGTMELTLNLTGDKDAKWEWWVDSAYAVHPNLRSHTGVAFSMGKGAPICLSTKQKLNTKSSTEAELVATDDAMSTILWTTYFLQGMGFTDKVPVLYQDNKSAMLLEKNGMKSSSKRTKHINVRYFFIKDRIDAGELSLEYCPTEEMVADFLSKPLQGKLFKKFRALILNDPYDFPFRTTCGTDDSDGSRLCQELGNSTYTS